MQTFPINKPFYFKAALITLLTVVCCTITMIMVGSPETTGQSTLYMILCIVGAPSLFGFFYILSILFTKEAPLTINQGGLLDLCRGSEAGSISWSNIHSISGFQRGRYKYLLLGITDIRALLDQVDIAKRMAFEKKLQREKDHVAIMLNQLKGDPDEIFETIKQQWKDATGRE